MKLKTVIFSTLVILICSPAIAQIGVTFHQSNLPFIGINKQLGERFLPELRVGTDNFFEDTSLELAVNLLIVKRSNFDFYSGLGGRVQILEGVVIPVGVNYYPLENKNFGFHIELAGIISPEDANLLRGSWGVRFNLE